MTVRRFFWDGPERARLDGAIREAAIALAQFDAEERNQSWWLAADQQIKLAGEYLTARNLQQGWTSLQSANRAILLNNKDKSRLRLTAIELRREMAKLSGWRARAIEDLICDDKGEVRENIEDLRVFCALAIRDDQFQTDYFRISLRRRHLKFLFWLLVAGITASLVLASLGRLPEPFNNVKVMAGVVIFGAFGAALSVARGLLKADLSAKIPSQQIGAVVVWMRPAIGAAAALISWVLLSVGAIRLFNLESDNPTLVFTVAIVSGFSERFIVGAIEKIGQDKTGEDRKKDGGGAKAAKTTGKSKINAADANSDTMTDAPP
jgi:hypothetical protein